MFVQRAFKYRLYPSTTQCEQLAKQFGAARWVFNRALRERMDHYADTGKGLSFAQQCRNLTQVKTQEEFAWLRESNSQSLQQSLQNLDTAYIRFFKGIAEFPTFKKKHRKQSFRVTQNFKLDSRSITIPKIGRIKARVHRAIGDESEIRSLTISRTPAGKYYVSVLCKSYLPDPTYAGNTIGVDLGIKDYLVDSDGNKIPNPKYLQRSLAKLRRLDQIKSKKVIGSGQYVRLKHKIARLYDKIHNQRMDFLHKLSLRLVNDNQVIATETLSVKKLMIENYPELARYIQDAAWYTFLTLLEYKGSWYGCHINKIDRYYPSSKRCNHCGYIKQDLKLSDREWRCPECNTLLDRDVNAAKNILNFVSIDNNAVGTTV